MENVMESVTQNKYPIIKEIKELMIENNAMNSVMSGSGPSIFGVFEEISGANTAAVAVKEALKAKNVKAMIKVTEFYNERNKTEG